MGCEVQGGYSMENRKNVDVDFVDDGEPESGTGIALAVAKWPTATLGFIP